MKGNLVQYLHYAPYGELVANQMPYGIDERFKFTGKERDAETGYDNHDARYRWTVSGDWLSVDPLADKFIGTQPYLYCNGDPVGYKDPTGMYYDEANEITAQNFEKDIQAHIDKLTTTYGDNMPQNISDCITELQKSLTDISDMRMDLENEYRFINTTTNDGATEYSGLNASFHPIINISVNFGNLGLVLHEARHGGQFARREMKFIGTSKPFNTLIQFGYGVHKEVDAYRAQCAWTGTMNILRQNPNNKKGYLLPVSIRNITPFYVNSLATGSISSPVLVYPPIGYSAILWNIF